MVTRQAHDGGDRGAAGGARSSGHHLGTCWCGAPLTTNRANDLECSFPAGHARRDDSMLHPAASPRSTTSPPSGRDDSAHRLIDGVSPPGARDTNQGRDDSSIGAEDSLSPLDAILASCRDDHLKVDDLGLGRKEWR